MQKWLRRSLTKLKLGTLCQSVQVKGFLHTQLAKLPAPRPATGHPDTFGMRKYLSIFILLPVPYPHLPVPWPLQVLPLGLHAKPLHVTLSEHAYPQPHPRTISQLAQGLFRGRTNARLESAIPRFREPVVL